MTTQVRATWAMQGQGLGACSCDWGCPCNFDATPTKGWCQGTYICHISEGRAGDVPLDGLTVALIGSSPAAIHLGNLTSLTLLDERATPQQREALSPILRGEQGGIFGIFASLSTKILGPEVVPVEWRFNGSDSYARFGDILDVKLDDIKNPVTGEVSGFTLKFSNGLLTDQAELMKSSLLSLKHPELSFDHSGQYGETFRFNWSGGAQ